MTAAVSTQGEVAGAGAAMSAKAEVTAIKAMTVTVLRAARATGVAARVAAKAAKAAARNTHAALTAATGQW